MKVLGQTVWPIFTVRRAEPNTQMVLVRECRLRRPSFPLPLPPSHSTTTNSVASHKHHLRTHIFTNTFLRNARYRLPRFIKSVDKFRPFDFEYKAWSSSYNGGLTWPNKSRIGTWNVSETSSWTIQWVIISWVRWATLSLLGS